MSRPNILLILTDQQRVDSLGAYGGAPARTPAVDGLADRGTRFTRAFTPVTVCSPARASLFTGLYPHQHGVTQNGDVIRPGTPNLAQGLTASGYRLGYAGKWHIDDIHGPSHFGFDAKDWMGYAHPAGGVYMKSFTGSWKQPANHYVEYLYERDLAIPQLEDSLYRPANHDFEIFARQTGPVKANYEYYVTEESIGLLDRFARYQDRDDTPFFIWTNYWGPHNPYILPEPYFSMFDPADVELSPSMRETWAKKPYIQHAVSYHYQGVDLLDDEVWREIVAKYAGYCAFIDDEVGRLMARLDALGLTENTIVIFSSDHGSMVGHHRLIDKGPHPYDDIQRIPLIAAGPGITPGVVCDEFVYLHDLMLTIMEWAAPQAEKQTPSARGNTQSLVPLLAGGNLSTPRDDVYMTRHGHPFIYEQRFLRTNRYKYAFNSFDIDELYDLETDPDEMENRIDDPAYAEVRADLIARMARHIVAQQDPIRGCFKVLTSTPSLEGIRVA